jgi:hypothetical protein
VATTNFDEENDEKYWNIEDKFKPRKPRFYNAVQSGFEWNKYN